MPKLTDAFAKKLAAPASGARIHYDDEVKGWGLRITASGARAFVLNYRSGGTERRITIGAFPDWSVSAARERARELKRQIDRGEDPMAERHRDRVAPTVADLAARYMREHAPRKRTGAGDASMLNRHVLPRFGRLKVAAVRHVDVADLHRDIAAETPIQANRVVALVSKLFSLAIRWEMRSDNPGLGVERCPETKRERFLTPQELERLNTALAAHPRKASVDAIRLLLLTGARRNEVLSAQWSQFDLSIGSWTKPASTTKQKRTHRVPLNAAAVELLTAMRVQAKGPALFPGRGPNATQGELKRTWASVCKTAKLDGLRLHDLRHSYASFLASSGLSLPVIGALLGHSDPVTTSRYAHLIDDALRAATERVGALVGSGR